MKTNPVRVGLVFAVFVALVHVGWSVLVATHCAQWLVDYNLYLHFVKMPVTVAARGQTSDQVAPASVLRHNPEVPAYMVRASTGSKAKKRTVPRRLNMRQLLPPSCVM